MTAQGRARDYVVGVDGGGTGSRALVMDRTGRELARGEGPPALIDPSNPGAAAEAIAETVQAAVSSADRQLPAAGLWTGLAGAGRQGSREAVEIALRSMGLASETKVGMDVEGAHWDAFGSDPGILMAVGTGSVVWGRDPEGGELRVGGLGSLLSEEGSGYWLGLEGLRAVVRAADGREPPTSLTGSLFSATGQSDVQGLVGWVAEATKGDVGALAPMVLDHAKSGDEAAERIREKGLLALGQYLEAIRRAWAPWGNTFPLALAGGLLGPQGALRDHVIPIASSLGADLHPQVVVPVRGAALLALSLFQPA